jgi:hypothetical protein
MFVTILYVILFEPFIINNDKKNSISITFLLAFYLIAPILSSSNHDQLKIKKTLLNHSFHFS